MCSVVARALLRLERPTAMRMAQSEVKRASESDVLNVPEIPSLEVARARLEPMCEFALMALLEVHSSASRAERDFTCTAALDVRSPTDSNSTASFRSATLTENCGRSATRPFTRRGVVPCGRVSRIFMDFLAPKKPRSINIPMPVSPSSPRIRHTLMLNLP
ncbi:hypothetical protein DFH09DRAFT_1124548 [Mycena vulgaris]|nr:hypothetical protein DFH09DRAFT_1124548 [Mycena vulgaris]